MSHAIRDHVRKILLARAADNEAEAAKIQEIEAAGGRIITGGQIDKDEWEILDWRTEERLAHGHNGLDGYAEACLRLDPEGRWHHIDPLTEEIGLTEPSLTDGVPLSLAEALLNWVESLSTPDEEIAEIAGWDVAEVARCLGYEDD
ncbi:hypothetical protein [Streptosporangium jomthongense]|uniref:Immunity protein Imm1 n=1 Tax=Streptosporangium jomthongense TaxID=1193683 RepID=A0ABV8FD46_9ACTN